VTTSAPGLAGGRVARASGPWLSSGDWWSPRPWDDEEWDVALADGGIYRLSRDRHTGRWTITGQWD
jgi:protein ImuB